MDRKTIKLHAIYEFIKWYLTSTYAMRLGDKHKDIKHPVLLSIHSYPCLTVSLKAPELRATHKKAPTGVQPHPHSSIEVTEERAGAMTVTRPRLSSPDVHQIPAWAHTKAHTSS